ncbi:MAG: methyltransferase domain-containing protein [Patescibacteria group bacterium]|mgnify:CR=1 FL=1
MPFSDPKTVVDQFNLKEGMVVADFGTGSGAYALAMARRVGRSGRIYALEVQKEVLTKLEREVKTLGLDNISIIWADLERSGGSKLADGTVDLVVVANLLFQVSAKYSLLLEAKRLLRREGKLVIIDWQDSFGGLGPIPDHVVTAAAAGEVAAQAGFRLVKEFPAGDHHYGLIFEK